MNETTKPATKRKFNLIDLIVIIVVVAALVFVGVKFLGNKGEVASDTEKYIVTFFGEEVPYFVVQDIKAGDAVYDDAEQDVVGTVTDVKLDPSVTFVTTDEGQILQTTKIGHNSIKLACEIEATEFSNGIIVGSTRYGIGHSLVIRAGDAKMYLKVYDIQKASELELDAETSVDETGAVDTEAVED